MSPSDRPAAGSNQPSPEIVAIAVALAAVWAEAPAPVVEGPASQSSPWRWAGRRWERQAGHRWS